MQQSDVVIIGGGVVGSSSAYFLASQPDFKGSITVIEKDPTYNEAPTPRSADQRTTLVGLFHQQRLEH